MAKIDVSKNGEYEEFTQLGPIAGLGNMDRKATLFINPWKSSDLSQSGRIPSESKEVIWKI